MSVGEVETVPVTSERMNALESEHTFLEMIKAKNNEAVQAQLAWESAKERAAELKKEAEKKDEELRSLILNGPPKPDPQKKLPFVDEAPSAQAEKKPVPVAPVEAKPVEEKKSVEIPEEIAKLDLTDLQKQRLAETGAKTLAELVDIGNGNWPDYAKGFASIDGFGPKAIAKLQAQLPSSAPPPKPDQGEEKVRVSLLQFNENPMLVPGKVFEATKLENGNVIIQLPGSDPVEFLPTEYELAP